MKKFLSILISIVLLFLLCACEGNFSQVDLQSDIAIPEDGIIEKSVLNQIKDENEIATFTGKSGSYSYEWTVFGSDIVETKDINLLTDIKNKDGIIIEFSQKEDFGFPMLLSVYLNEKWDYLSATAYSDDKPVYSVSLTGTKESILNISVNKIVESCIITPDTTQQQTTENNVVSSDKDKTKNDSDDVKTDEYLSGSLQSGGRVYSDGSDSEQDKYKTDPIPQGKPRPVEPENQDINNEKTYTCTFSIECSTILNNLEDLDPDKLELVPSNGVILPATTVTFFEGESVFDVLQRVCKENNIHLESSWTPIYNSAYIEGIHNLYEFDCGNLSGWTYRVNGWYPNYGCSRYQLVQGEVVEWRYTCDLGKDVGCDWMG